MIGISLVGIFLGYKYNGRAFLRTGAFAPVAPPSATHLGTNMSWNGKGHSYDERNGEQGHI